MHQFNLEFTEQEVNILVAALGELPAKMSYDLITKIKEHVVSQSNELNKEDK